MMKHLLILAALAAVCGFGTPVAAQNTNAIVVASCGTPPTTYSAGQNRQVTQSTGGLVCNSTSGSVTAGPLGVTPTDKSGTIASGGTAQTAIALNASRKGWCIQNPPTATEVLYVRSGTTATTTTGVTLSAGQQACSLPGLIDTGLISVLGATTSHAFQGTEYQ